MQSCNQNQKGRKLLKKDSNLNTAKLGKYLGMLKSLPLINVFKFEWQ